MTAVHALVITGCGLTAAEYRQLVHALTGAYIQFDRAMHRTRDVTRAGEWWQARDEVAEVLFDIGASPR